jgi:hypothetical protein
MTRRLYSPGRQVQAATTAHVHMLKEYRRIATRYDKTMIVHKKVALTLIAILMWIKLRDRA